MSSSRRRLTGSEIERDIARVADPFEQAARLWSAGEAERRRALDRPSRTRQKKDRRRDRRAILAVGRTRILSSEGYPPVAPSIHEDPRIAGSTPMPEFYVPLEGQRGLGHRGEPVALGPESAARREPRSDAPRVTPDYDVRAPQRTMRSKQRAGRPRYRQGDPLPSGSLRTSESPSGPADPVPPAPIPGRPGRADLPAAVVRLLGRTTTRTRGEISDRVPAPVGSGLSPGAREIERDVAWISRAPEADRPSSASAEDRVALRALMIGPVHPVPSSASASASGAKSRREVLASLNAKYGTHVAESWRMLAYLRGAADRLAASRSGGGRLDELLSDHARLRRAPEDDLP